jgi:hypothetical protein
MSHYWHIQHFFCLSYLLISGLISAVPIHMLPSKSSPIRCVPGLDLTSFIKLNSCSQSYPGVRSLYWAVLSYLLPCHILRSGHFTGRFCVILGTQSYPEVRSLYWPVLCHTCYPVISWGQVTLLAGSVSYLLPSHILRSGHFTGQFCVLVTQ